MKRNLLNCLKI